MHATRSIQPSQGNFKGRGAFRVLAVCSALAFLGCGAGEYNKRVEDALAQLEKTSKFSRVLHDTESTINPGASFRIPQIFGDDDTDSFRLGDAQSPIRIQPPIQLPGFLYNFERRFGDPGREVPVYVYVAAAKAEGMSQQQLLASLQKSIRSAFPAAAPGWEQVDVDTPEGTTISVQRTSVSGSQRFDVGQQLGGIRQHDGRLDVYVYTEAGQHIIIAWRAPDSAIQESGLFESAPLSVGTLKVEELQPEGDA